MHTYSFRLNYSFYENLHKFDTNYRFSTMSSVHVDVDVLIVGAGPAGASLACFLASYGVWKILLIMKRKKTSKQDLG